MIQLTQMCFSWDGEGWMEKKSTQMLMDTFQSKESHGIKHHFRCAKAQIWERYGVYFPHHDAHTHWIQKNNQAEGSSNNWPVSLYLKRWATLKHAWPHFSQPLVYLGRKPGTLLKNILYPRPLLCVILQREANNLQNGSQILIQLYKSLLLGLKKMYSRLVERQQLEESIGLSIRTSGL